MKPIIKVEQNITALGIDDWLILGPFVVDTGESFEREYLYEREKILNIDYLNGENSIYPEEGMRQKNNYVGPPFLVWERCRGNSIGFTGKAGNWLYETVQRNTIYYSATYLEMENNTYALLNLSHSGVKIWVNENVVLNEPYGRTKGLDIKPKGAIIFLKKGINRILLKVRPGYIADGVDFNFRDFTIYPSIGNFKSVHFFCPKVENLFFFFQDYKEQVFEVTIGNVATEKTSNFEVGLLVKVESGEKRKKYVEIDGIAGKAYKVVRLGIPFSPKDAFSWEEEKFERRSNTHNYEVTILYKTKSKEKEIYKFHHGINYLDALDEELTGYVYTDFHFDTTYHEEQRVYAMGAFDICRRYCEQYRQDPNFKAIISEVDYLKPYFDLFVEDRELLRKMFHTGRAEADCMYNQPNEMSISGEGFIRNIIYGQYFHKNVLGRSCLVYCPGDVFGHPNQMSQIIRKSGCIGIGWDKHIIGFPPIFWHLALDGSKLLHRRGNVSKLDAKKLCIKSFLANIDKTPPTEWTKNLVPKIVQAVPSEFHIAMQEGEKNGGKDLPVTARDMSLYHAGTSLTRIDLKIANRLGENVLIDAEKFSVIAYLLGAKYPDYSLDKAWRQLLCGQHHDSITGTHNEISFIDLMIGYREVIDLGSEVIKDATRFITNFIKTNGEGIPIVVFNSLTWARREVCRCEINFEEPVNFFSLYDANGKSVNFQIVSLKKVKKTGFIKSAEITFIAEVPSFGYKVYYVKKTNQIKDNVIVFKNGLKKNFIENEFFRIKVDEKLGGGIVSLFDKEEDREVLNSREGKLGNEITVLQEWRDRDETQHEFYTTGLKLKSSEYPAKIRVEEGSVTKRIIIDNKLAEICDLRQEIILYSGIRRIDFRTFILNYQREDDLFTVTFPLNMDEGTVTFDERFGAVVRRESERYLDFRTHQMFMFSGCAVYPSYQWVDYGKSSEVRTIEKGKVKDSFSIGMTGIVLPNNEICIDLSNKLQEVLIKKGIPSTPYFDNQNECIGTMPKNINEDFLYVKFRIAIATLKHKNSYIQRLLANLGKETRKRIINDVVKEGVVCLLIRDEQIANGVNVLIVLGRDETFIERKIKEFETSLDTDDAIYINEKDNFCKGSKIANYGVSLINFGNIAQSVEAGHVLTMMLFHTALWYGGTKNFPQGYLVPERKNHLFLYSLYPHKGSWRESKTYLKGYEFNNPLIAIQTDKHDGNMPSENSFMTVKPDNLVVTAIKKQGNPIAEFKGKNYSENGEIENKAKGITLRFYEACGKPTRGEINFYMPINSACSMNLLEEKEREIKVKKMEGLSVKVSPFSIETIGLALEPSFLNANAFRRGGNKIGVEKEPVQPVFIRSWEHDAGTMPLGYEMVVGSISRKVIANEKEIQLKVNFVNDYIDIPVSGEANLVVPDGWKAEPLRLKYKIKPLGHKTYDVRVVLPTVGAKGIIKLRYEHKGQTFQDILEVGKCFNPDFKFIKDGNEFYVFLKNDNEEELEGEVAIASPLETWSEKYVEPYSLLKIYPRTIGFLLKPHEEKTLVFKVKENDQFDFKQSFWVVAKLMINGRIYLRRIDIAGESMLMRSSKMWKEVREGKKRLEEII